MHHGVQLLLFRIGLRFHHLLKRTDNQGKGGAELVTDIRKKAHLGLGKLLLLAHFEPFDTEFVFLLHTHGEKAQQQPYGTAGKQKIEGTGPPRSPQRRLHHDGKRSNIVAPHLRIVAGLHFERVGARIQVGVGGKTLRRVVIDPLVVESLQLTSVDDIGRNCCIRSGKLQGETLVAVQKPYLFNLRDTLRKHYPSVYLLVDGDRLIKDS